MASKARRPAVTGRSRGSMPKFPAGASMGRSCAWPTSASRCLTPTDAFDVVLDSDAVTCNSLTEARRIYAEMHRVTRAGGLMYVRTPAAGSWGDGTGEPHGDGAWRCSEGPFAGTGVVRFTREDEITSLLGPWHVMQLEQVKRTLDNRSHHVTEWVVVARKEAA